MTTIAGGIIGSVLTLTVVPYTPYFETFANETGQQLTETGSNSGLNVQKTAATNNSSTISDMVADASKSIVGIVNMQDPNTKIPSRVFRIKMLVRLNLLKMDLVQELFLRRIVIMPILLRIIMLLKEQKK